MNFDIKLQGNSSEYSVRYPLAIKILSPVQDPTTTLSKLHGYIEAFDSISTGYIEAFDSISTLG